MFLHVPTTMKQNISIYVQISVTVTFPYLRKCALKIFLSSHIGTRKNIKYIRKIAQHIRHSRNTKFGQIQTFDLGKSTQESPPGYPAHAYYLNHTTVTLKKIYIILK